MKVVGYLRVSTDRQAEKGHGLPVQERAIRDWAKTHRHRIVDIHRDGGVSGSNGLEHRIALPDALDDLRAGRAGGLVVWRLDRLARDLIVQEQLLADIRRIGAEPFSTSSAEAAVLTDDPDDPSRKLIRQVLGAVSEYEKAMIVLRMKRGREHKARRGGFAYGSPPYGLRAVAGELVADEVEAATIVRIRELRRLGLSLRQIADALTVEGYRPKRSDRWHPESLRRIVARL